MGWSRRSLRTAAALFVSRPLASFCSPSLSLADLHQALASIGCCSWGAHAPSVALSVGALLALSVPAGSSASILDAISLQSSSPVVAVALLSVVSAFIDLFSLVVNRHAAESLGWWLLFATAPLKASHHHHGHRRPRSISRG